MVEMDGEKLMVSSSNFDDGSMIVSVGTTDFNNYGDSDFMEMMINKDGKIDYFTLPTGKDDYQRMYKIKPSHYGRMKTQNETNESAGGDFIRTDGDGKYGTSFGAEGQPIYERKYRQIVVDDKLKNKLQMLESIIKSLNEAIQGGRFDVVETEALRRAVSEVYSARDILMGGYWEAESFGAEEGQFYQLEIKSNMADGWEWVADFTNQQDAINAYYEHYDKHPEVQIVEVDSDGDGEVLLQTRNYNLGAESFGAEMKLPKLTKTQMDLLRYSRWFQTYSAYARGQSDRYWSPEDWKDGKVEQCFTITSDGWGNDNIARRTLKSLLEKKVLYATKTNYFAYDGRIRKSPAQQVNENPDLVSKLTSVCLGLTPIGVEIIKREFARQVKDVVGWRIELTLEDGQTAYLSDMPDEIAQSIDNHIEEVKWDMGGEQFGAEPVEWDEWIGEQCQNCKKGPMYDIVEVEEESGEEHYANKCKSCGYQTSWYAETLKAESFGADSEKCPKCDAGNLGKEEMYYCYTCGNDDASEDGCLECGSDAVGEEEMDYCYNCGEHGHWFNAESFGAELLDYPHPMSDRQKHRIRKLGGRIDKAMSRSQASQYIKSLMRIEPLHAETHALDCSACQGWGWNEDLNMVCDADGCIGGWVVPKKPSLLERGLELGAGVGMGMAGVAILFGFLGGTVGFAAEEMKKRRD
ncbi:hypothetical protein [Planktomarina sp.]|uniref:hypothetical protein n=1 Tax=Planktomarina sp. TaxID=2024851 RepID=UPI000C950612|nr:hypothetical protein [Paracoccaceae bacterium]